MTAADYLRRQGSHTAANSSLLTAARAFTEADEQMPTGRYSLNVNHSLQTAIALYTRVVQPPSPHQSSPLAAGAHLQLSAVYQSRQLQLAAEQLLQAAKGAPGSSALLLCFRALDITVSLGDLFRSEQILRQIGERLDDIEKYGANVTTRHHRNRWMVTYLLLILTITVPGGVISDPLHQSLLNRFSVEADTSHQQIADSMDESLFISLQSLVMAAEDCCTDMLVQLAESINNQLDSCQHQLLIMLIEQAELRQLPTHFPSSHHPV